MAGAPPPIIVPDKPKVTVTWSARQDSGGGELLGLLETEGGAAAPPEAPDKAVGSGSKVLIRCALGLLKIEDLEFVRTLGARQRAHAARCVGVTPCGRCTTRRGPWRRAAHARRR